MSDTAPSNSPQQVEAARFRSAVSEALLQSMQANINFLLPAVLPIGSVVASVLSEADFQDQTSENWVLADGRDISGSDLAVLTGVTTAPDLRGRYPRGKDHGTGRDSAGNLATGTAYSDTVVAHTHGIDHNHAVKAFEFGGGPNVGPLWGNGGTQGNPNTNPNFQTTSAFDVANSQGVTAPVATAAETRVKSVVVNYFIRIN